MDTYVRTIILFLVYVIVEVNGQGGGGVAIPWGQGVNINMAEFDPFANLRGGRSSEAKAAIMDPHDPNRPKFAPDSPYVGGSVPNIWSKDRSSSSFSASLSSSNEASSSTKVHTQTRPRPHESGGVAISLTGALPSNDRVNVSSNSSFIDTAWWNENVNASALNVQMYPDMHNAFNESVYAESYNALNVSVYPDVEYTSYTNMSMYHAFENASYANVSMYPDFENASYGGNDFDNYYNRNISVNPSANSTDSFNVSAMYDSYLGVGGLPVSMADLIPNEALNDTFVTVNETLDSSSYKNISNYNNTIRDMTYFEHNNASRFERTDRDFIANTFKMTNGLFVPESIVNVRFNNSINAALQNNNQERNAPGTNKDLRTFNQIGSEMNSPFYDKVHEKLRALNKIYQVSANNTEITGEDDRMLHNRSLNKAVPSHPPAIHVPASWADGINNASDTTFVENTSPAEGSSMLNNFPQPDFNPFKTTKDTTYDLRVKPAIKSVKKPTTGMGVPVSFGLNLPSVPVERTPEEPFVVDSFVEVPIDLGTRPKMVSGVQSGSIVTLRNEPKSVDIATSKQDSIRFDRSDSNQVSMVDTRAPAERWPRVQQTVRKEPEPPISRQPIIETQPAVDFMSTFLSQPIDPTRRGDRQKTVDTQTDISIVPLENQQSVAGPSQTLAQDAKSRDWRSFISSFLMGGDPGFEQLGPPAFGPVDSTGLSGMRGPSQSGFGVPSANQMMDVSSQGQMAGLSRSQMDVGSQGQMDVSVTGSMDRQAIGDVSRSQNNQMGGRSPSLSGNEIRSQTYDQMDRLSRQTDTKIKPQVTDTIMDQGQMAGLSSSQMDVGSQRQMDVSVTGSMARQAIGDVSRSQNNQMSGRSQSLSGNEVRSQNYDQMDRLSRQTDTKIKPHVMDTIMDHGQMAGLSRSQMDVGSHGQMDVSETGSMDRQAIGDVSRSQNNQMSGRSQSLSGNEVRSQNYGQMDRLSRQTDTKIKPQVTDTIMDQTRGQFSRQVEGRQLGSLDMAGGASLDTSSGLSLGQIQEPRFVTADQSIPQDVGRVDSNFPDSKLTVIDLTSSGSPSGDRTISFNPVKGIRDANLPGGVQTRGPDLGMNIQYDVAKSSQNQMENVIGLSDTRPLDMPQAAEATSVPSKVTAMDSSLSASSSPLDIGLSNKPLTSFEGASPSDLQKLKLLEVAQRLLLQERGIKDPQAGTQVQTFTPLGMSGGLESILMSLNQANNMGEMIKSSLSQGSSQTPMTSAQTPKDSLDIVEPTTTAPKRNVKLGEWSSGVPVGTERQDSVPIGNIFAGRFLQSGTGIPSVGGGSVSPTVGIPISQSLAAKVASTLSSSATAETTTGTRGGGLVIKDKLPVAFQRQCNAVRDPTSKYHFYRTVGAGRIRFRCALGTAFDVETCECSIRVISNGDCLEVLMNFNNGRVEDVSPNQLPVGSMNVEITNRTAAYPGIAVFDGNAKLTIWRYQNYDFRDHVMLKLRFRPGVGGDRYQTIIANCDGSPDGPSIAIVFDKQANEVIMILRTTTNNDKDLRFKIDPSRWSEITYLYDGNSFIGLVNNNQQSMPTQGLVEISDEALVLGHCPQYGNFNGAIDDVKIYTCIPKENQFLL